MFNKRKIEVLTWLYSGVAKSIEIKAVHFSLKIKSLFKVTRKLRRDLKENRSKILNVERKLKNYRNSNNKKATERDMHLLLRHLKLKINNGKIEGEE